MRTRTAPQRGFNLDYLMWLFTRLSGLGLFMLALIGVVGAMLLGAREQVDLPALMRWTFFPNPNHVVNSNIPDVTQGWANAFWQIMMILVLFLGVTHGFNGLRMVIEDYLGQSVSQVLLRGVIFLLWLFFIVMGVFVILAS
jgi:succinate dehydrogenase / fumarate reductase, membrane anchor subunit